MIGWRFDSPGQVQRVIRDPTGWEWRGFEDWGRDNRLCLGLDKTRKQEARERVVWGAGFHPFFKSRGPKKRLIDQRAMTMLLLLLAVVAVSLASLLPWLGWDANQSGRQASFARGVLLPVIGTGIVKSTSFTYVRKTRSVSRKKKPALVR